MLGWPNSFIFYTEVLSDWPCSDKAENIKFEMIYNKTVTINWSDYESFNYNANNFVL